MNKLFSAADLRVSAFALLHVSQTNLVQQQLGQDTLPKLSQSILFPEKLEVELRDSSHLEPKGLYAYVNLKAETGSVLE